MAFCSVSDVLKFPRQVAFRGSDGMFLTLEKTGSCKIMRFKLCDLADDSIRCQVDKSEDNDEIVLIKHLRTDNFLEVGNEKGRFVVRTTSDRSDPRDGHFQAIKIDARTVALRSMAGTPKYCLRANWSDGTDVLEAKADTLEKATHLTVVETVLRRRVHSIKYDTDIRQIYASESLALGKATVSNMTSNSATVVIAVEYTESIKKGWNNSNSLKAGVAATFEARIPFIAKGKIEVPGEDNFIWKWGEEKEEGFQETRTYKLQVKSQKTMEVTLEATKAKYDVKFSYVQEDVMYTGKTVEVSCEDGVFKGMNYFAFNFTAREVTPQSS